MPKIKLLDCSIAKLFKNNATIKQFNNSKPKGFTLIELLVVIAIIGILATFIVASFTSAQQKARDSKRKSNLDAVKKALELAKSNCTGGAWYPGVGTGIIPIINYQTALTNYLPPLGYIKNMPPQDNPAYQFKTYESGANFQTLVCPNATTGVIDVSGSTDYRLYINLENANDPQPAATQTKCPAAGFNNVTYNATLTYVVCGD